MAELHGGMNSIGLLGINNHADLQASDCKKQTKEYFLSVEIIYE